MATEIRESIILNQERWRVFELFKMLSSSPALIGRIGSARKLPSSNAKGLSHWQARYGRLEFDWNQEEIFSDLDYSVMFKMVEGDFERLEGRLELNGSDAGRETRLGLTLSIDWQPTQLDRQSRESLLRKARFAVRKFLRQIQRDSDEGPLRPVLQEIGLQHLESFFGSPLPVQVRNDYREMRILTELDQQGITQVIDFLPPFLKVQKIVIASDGGESRCSRSLAMGRISETETAGHYNNSIFLALCGQLMASSTSIHLAALFPKTAPHVIEANGVKPIDLSSSTVKMLKPAKQGSVFFVDSQIIRKKLRLVSATCTIYFGNLRYGVIENLKLILAPTSSLHSIAELPPG